MPNAINPKKQDIIAVIAAHSVLLAIILRTFIYCPTVTSLPSTQLLILLCLSVLFVVCPLILLSYRVLQDTPPNARLLLCLIGVDIGLVIAGSGYLLAAAGLSVTGQCTASHNSLDGLYLSAMTFTTVGYGDVTPAPGIGRLIAATEALTSYVLLALFIANIIEFAKRPKPDNQSKTICASAPPAPPPNAAQRPQQ